MNFCSSCGKSVIKQIPEGDNRERHVCLHCVTIHYENPKVIAGVLPVYGDQVLLCRRAIEPRHGFWTLPAGFLENGESSLTLGRCASARKRPMPKWWSQASTRCSISRRLTRSMCFIAPGSQTAQVQRHV